MVVPKAETAEQKGCVAHLQSIFPDESELMLTVALDHHRWQAQDAVEDLLNESQANHFKALADKYTLELAQQEQVRIA